MTRSFIDTLESRTLFATTIPTTTPPEASDTRVELVASVDAVPTALSHSLGSFTKTFSDAWISQPIDG